MPFIGNISMPEMIVFGIVALLLFGKRLPEVMRSMGQGVSEFKKGLSGIQTDLTSDNNRSSEQRPSRTATASIAPPPSMEPVGAKYEEPVGSKYEG